MIPIFCCTSRGASARTRHVSFRTVPNRYQAIFAAASTTTLPDQHAIICVGLSTYCRQDACCHCTTVRDGGGGGGSSSALQQTMKRQLAEAMAEKSAMRDEVRTLRSEIARLGAKLESQAASHRAELDTLNESLGTVRAERDALRGSLDATREERDDIRAQLATTSKEAARGARGARHRQRWTRGRGGCGGGGEPPPRHRRGAERRPLGLRPRPRC